MKTAKRVLLTAVLSTGLLGAVGTVSAQETAIYDWPASDTPVLIESASGVILLGQEGKPVRAFSWNQNGGEHDRAVRLLDMDGDNQPNIVGSGTPSFILQANGDPVFGEESGCRQVLVAPLVGRRGRGQSLVCVKNQEVRVYTGDGQFAWAVSPGRNLDYCRTGDVTGDGRPDIECKYRGQNRFLRLSADGEMLAQSGETQLLEDGAERLEFFAPVSSAVWGGEQQFDLNGDGNARESLHATESGLEVRGPGSEEPLFVVETDAEPRAALVKDLNGDGKVSIIAVTERRIFVASQGGEEVQSFNADARRYNRVPFADLVSVHARGFGEKDAEAREAVSAIQSRISQCYGNRLRAHPFAGSGRQMVQVVVGQDGRVQRVEQMASQVGDSQVESCARQALERGSYPAAADDSATINVNIVFTFRDEER